MKATPQFKPRLATINKEDITWTLQHTFSYSLIALSVLLVGAGITYTMAKQLAK